MSTSIKARFGPWLLVKLTTGRWSAVWHAFVGTEAFDAILDEDQVWFDRQCGYSRPEVQETELAALETIQKKMMEGAEASVEMRDYLDRELRKAATAIAKIKRETSANTFCACRS